MSSVRGWVRLPSKTVRDSGHARTAAQASRFFTTCRYVFLCWYTGRGGLISAPTLLDLTIAERFRQRDALDIGADTGRDGSDADCVTAHGEASWRDWGVVG